MSETRTPVAPGRHWRTTVLVVAALAVVAADQATKVWALHSLDPLRRPSLFGGFLTLHVELCGAPIGKARLQAFPRAILCVQCKQRQERH